MSSNIYAQDGVSVKDGDSFSSFCAEICRQSYENSRFAKVRDWSQGYFRGPRSIHLTADAKDCDLGLAPDGVGTKPNLIVAADNYEAAAHNLAAMCWGDADAVGGKTVVMTNVLDVAKIGKVGTPTNLSLRRMIVGFGKIAAE